MTWNHAKVIKIDQLYPVPGSLPQYSLELPDGRRVAVPADLTVSDGDRVIVIPRDEWERRVNAKDISE